MQVRISLAREELALAIGIVINIVLIILKVVVGLLFGYLVLISDAVHSLSDLLTGVILYIGWRISQRPADECHPYGHWGFESLASLTVPLALIAAATAIVIEAIRRLLRGFEITISLVPIVVLVVDLVLKLWVSLYSERIGEETKSIAVKASATHHMSDVYSTIGALVGAFGVLAGFRILDPLASIFIAILIALSAVEVARESIWGLTSGAPSRDILEKVREIIESFEDVKSVHDLRAHRIGGKVCLEAHAVVRSDMSLREAHDLEVRIKRKLKEIPEIESVYIHLDPEDRA